MSKAREALAELFACKDLKDEELRQRQRRPVRDPQKILRCNEMQAEYRRRSPLAWKAARVALAIPEPEAAPAAQTEPSQAAPVQGEGRRESQEAARYRWLRDYSRPGICTFYLSVGNGLHGVHFTRATVDEAIDAQIASSEGQQPGDGA